MKKTFLILMAVTAVQRVSQETQGRRHQRDLLQHPRRDRQRRNKFMGIPLPCVSHDDHGSEA